MQYRSKYIFDRINAKLSAPGMTADSQFLTALQTHQLAEDALDYAYKELRQQLSESMMLDHVIFLVGNGASTLAGPRNNHPNPMNYSGIRSCKYAKLPKCGKIKSELAEISKFSIDEQMNALITIKSYFSIMKDDRERAVSELIEYIKRDLIDICAESVDYRNLRVHETMLQKLRSFGALSRTQIYTTNYDLIFEYAMDTLSIDYKDGFSGFVNRWFNPGTFAECGKPSLVKLHGSVNWINENGRIREIQPKFKDGMVVTDEPDELDNVLIFPCSNKTGGGAFLSPYNDLMWHMLNELETGSNAVVVIGYKYGDSRINDILCRAMENQNNELYFFTFENPEETDGEFIKNVNQVADDEADRINILCGPVLASFNIFVKYILPEVQELTDENKASEEPDTAAMS